MSAQNFVSLFGKVNWAPKYLPKSADNDCSETCFTLVVQRSGSDMVDYISCVAYEDTADELSTLNIGEELIVKGEWRATSIKKKDRIEYRNECYVTDFSFTREHSEVIRKKVEEAYLKAKNELDDSGENSDELTDINPFK